MTCRTQSGNGLLRLVGTNEKHVVEIDVFDKDHSEDEPIHSYRIRYDDDQTKNVNEHISIMFPDLTNGQRKDIASAIDNGWSYSYRLSDTRYLYIKTIRSKD